MSYKVITPPTVEPVSIALARSHLRIGVYGDALTHPDDAYITGVLIPAAREHCENFTQRAFAEQTIEISLDFFPDQIELPMSPAKEIVSIKYMLGGVEQTLVNTSYSLDNYSVPAWLSLTANSSWPTADGVFNAIKVRYKTGADRVPAPVISAMLLIIGHLYENRQENVAAAVQSIPMGVNSLLAPYRVGMGV